MILRKAVLAATAAVVLLAGCSQPRSQKPSAIREVTVTPTSASTPAAEHAVHLQEFPVPPGSRPHDVAPASDGGVWYTAQGSGHLGHLDVASGSNDRIPLGDGSAPHGVIVGPDGAPWITDGGLNAIVRVDPATRQVRRYPVPRPAANLNTAAFDRDGILWFTGQAGVFGRLDPRTAKMDVFPAPKGRGPYGITTAPDGTPWFSSLAGSYVARVNRATGEPQVFEVPTAGGGGRRIWADSAGAMWVTEWFAGKLGRFDPGTGQWREWTLPGEDPQPYAVYVDERDLVWITDFGANALVRFDPRTEQFDRFPHQVPAANVRQLLGRPGEVWGAESGADRLLVARTG